MCGIAGFVGKGDEGVVRNMVQAIRYRGPDAEGVFVDKDFGLGHTRLSILDLTPSGGQPMWSTSRSTVIVFNGEVYNFRELRTRAEHGGYRFIGTSDTEVILALYEQHGEQSFAMLEGMFAIALYDMGKEKLFLVRDRMGKKPLYYTQVGQTLVFASEPKALFAHPIVKRGCDFSALHAYLALDYVPTPLSMYEGVSKLEPASYLIFEGGTLRVERYWNDTGAPRSVTFSDAKEELDILLDDAVASRLVADVPVGVFLSGGLDSSAIAYYASRKSVKPLHTFSVGFEESSFDESMYADMVAKHLGTAHHHMQLSASDSLAMLPEIFAKLDEPIADASIVPTALLARFTKEHVTVALGGDGGDELFAGYPTFQAEQAHRMLRRLPFGLEVRILSALLRATPPSSDYLSAEFKLRKFLEGANEASLMRRHLKWLGTWGKGDLAMLLRPEIRARMIEPDPFASALRYSEEMSEASEEDRLLFMYQRSYLMDQVMVKVDRASMYASLEARAPFLDRRVVEFANSLPYKYKLHGLTGKYILKETMEGKLPREIIHRSKKGFAVPVASWLRGPLREWGNELLSPENLSQSSIFDPVYVERLWSEHQKGIRDHRKRLWNILVFLEWWRNFMK